MSRLHMRRVLAVGLIGGVAVAVGGLAPAGASVVPGPNGKIVVGQVFPNFGFTIKPERLRSAQGWPAW
jgi:hypothetical protein